MDKKRQIEFNLNNFLLSTAMVQDILEKNIHKTSKNHSKRVAFLSLKIGKEFALNSKELSDLCSYSLIHNIALKKEKIYNKKHLEFAQELADKLPFLCNYKDIIKYHREYFNGSGVYRLKKDQIPLFSQIISLAHHLDEKFDFSCENIENRASIYAYLKKNQDILFSRDLVEKFIKISSKINFWLDIQNENDILYFIFSSLQDFSIQPTFEEALSYTSIFSLLFSENKNFLERCSKMADFYNFEHKDKQTFLIAASLKDIGKLAIPVDILENPNELIKNEYDIFKSYPYYTKKILDNLMGFSDISKWASRIEETIDGKGYPYELLGKDLSLKDRLMAILSKYQILSHNNKDTVKIMIEMVKNNKLDKAIVEDVSRELEY